MTPDLVDHMDNVVAAILETRGVPLAVERKGRTDCRECCYCPLLFWFGESFVKVHPNHAFKCAASGAWIRPAALEYCRDFVEIVL